MSIAKVYEKFWARALALPEEDLRSPRPQYVEAGVYVERHQDKYIYFYADLVTGKRILAASPLHMESLKRAIPPEQLNALNPDSIQSHPFFLGKTLAFNDIDSYLINGEHFKPVTSEALTFRNLKENETELLGEFYSNCSEEDKDTLDLTFENEVAVGAFHQDQLVGVSRYVAMTQTLVADITVVVRDSARGKGYSVPLVSELVTQIRANGLHPRYRVKEENFGSIAIAKKLGFTETHRILTWEAGA